jgi:hypothetical protein
MTLVIEEKHVRIRRIIVPCKKDTMFGGVSTSHPKGNKSEWKNPEDIRNKNPTPVYRWSGESD